MNSFDESRFRALWYGSEVVLRVRDKAHVLLQGRSVRTFDGLGHLLDYLLPEDEEELERLAGILRVSLANLDQLRAGRLDPFHLMPETLAELGKATALDFDSFTWLIVRDHERFSADDSTVVFRDLRERAGEPTFGALKAAWERLSSDEAHDL